MNLASLTTPEVKRLVTIFGVLAIAITLAVLAFRLDTLASRPVSTLLQSISGAVTVVTLSFAVLASIRWKRRFPAWLMDRPIVHGVWYGNVAAR